MYINVDKINDIIIPSTQDSVNKLTTAKDMISSTKIAEDFNYYTELRYTIPENIANSKVEMEKFKGWLDYAVLKAQYLEEINGILVGEELGEIDISQTKTNLKNFINDNPNIPSDVLKLITSEVIGGCGDNVTEEFYDIIVEDVYKEEIDSIMSAGNLGDYLNKNREVMNSQVLGVITCEVLTQWAWIVAEEAKENNVIYSINGRLGSTVEVSADFEKTKKTCCATFLSIIAYRSGLLDSSFINQYNYHYTGKHEESKALPKMFEDAGWKGNISEEEVQPGDICLYPPSSGNAGHVFIYLGNGYILDQSIACIRKDSETGNIISRPAEEVEQDWEDYKNNYDLMIWRPSELSGTEQANQPE